MRGGAECFHLRHDPLEQVEWHVTRFRADEIGPEIGVLVFRTDVAHHATQVAEIVDTQHDMGRTEGQVAWEKPLIRLAQPAQHVRMLSEMAFASPRTRKFTPYRIAASAWCQKQKNTNKRE